MQEVIYVEGGNDYREGAFDKPRDFRAILRYAQKKDRLWRQAAKDNRQKLLERFPDARKDWDEEIYEVDEVEWEQAAEAGWEVVATERSNPLRTRREVPGTLSATAPTPEGPFADTLIAAGLAAGLAAPRPESSNVADSDASNTPAEAQPAEKTRKPHPKQAWRTRFAEPYIYKPK